MSSVAGGVAEGQAIVPVAERVQDRPAPAPGGFAGDGLPAQDEARRARDLPDRASVAMADPLAAAEIQELYLAGRKGEAMMAVPGELIDEVALVGSKARIKERLSIWQDSPVTTLNLMMLNLESMRVMVELAG